MCPSADACELAERRVSLSDDGITFSQLIDLCARHLAAVVAVAVTLAAPAHAQHTVRDIGHLSGVNIAGAEFNGRKVPGIPNRDYFYPAKATMDYFAAKGMNSIRVPFLWERIQPQLNAALDPAELQRLNDVVRYANAKGLYVILDVHNYANYRQKVIGSAETPVAALADLWSRLAPQFKNNAKVGFGLMNEPKGLPTETWLAAANAAIAEIRRAGANNVVFVPGNGWTGAHSWLSRGYGTPNADVMLGIVDPAENYVYEVHQYLDSNYSGTHPECRNETVGVTTLKAFTDWLRQHNKRGYLGEFGAGANPTCTAALDTMLKFMDDNRDLWVGWSYWAAGAWPPSYFTSVQPVDGGDRPQMAVLLKHLARGRNDRAAR
jgi:endoglucanase